MVSEDYPVGVTDFAELVTGGYRFIDKTPMISHLCRNIGRSFMFARPRGFGKTLNLSMVDRFFNMRYADEQDVFEGLLVEEDAEAMELKNALPVIRLDLGGLGDDIERDLSAAVAEALRPFAGSEGLNDFDERFVEDCLGLGLDRVELWDSVRRMCYILEHLHGELPIVLVDDYDACFRGIRTKDRYREVSSIVGTFMEQTFKHNTCMRFGAIFAEMPSLRTGMFGGFDSYCLRGIEDREGEGFFGFSRGEVEGLLEEAESPSEDVDLLEERFGGFRIGDMDMLDPAGVISYLSGVREPSIRRGLPERFLSSLGAVPLYALRGLIENPGTNEEAVFDHMVSHVEAATPVAGMSQVCSYLSMAGFLRAERTGRQTDGWPVYRFGIPNGDVRDALMPLVRRAGYVEDIAGRAMDAIYGRDAKGVEAGLSEIFGMARSFLEHRENESSLERTGRYRDVIGAYLVAPELAVCGIGQNGDRISYGETAGHPNVLIGVAGSFHEGADPEKRMESALRLTERMPSPETDAIRIGVVVGEGTVTARFA